MDNLVRVTVRESFGRKHHGKNVTASNHQGMAKHCKTIVTASTFERGIETGMTRGSED